MYQCFDKTLKYFKQIHFSKCTNDVPINLKHNVCADTLISLFAFQSKIWYPLEFFAISALTTVPGALSCISSILFLVLFYTRGIKFIVENRNSILFSILALLFDYDVIGRVNVLHFYYGLCMCVCIHMCKNYGLFNLEYINRWLGDVGDVSLFIY